MSMSETAGTRSLKEELDQTRQNYEKLSNEHTDLEERYTLLKKEVGQYKEILEKGKNEFPEHVEGFNRIHDVLWNKYSDLVEVSKGMVEISVHVPDFDILDCYTTPEEEAEAFKEYEREQTLLNVDETSKREDDEGGEATKALNLEERSIADTSAPILSSEELPSSSAGASDSHKLAHDAADFEHLEYGKMKVSSEHENLEDFEFINLYDWKGADMLRVVPCQTGRLLVRKCYKEIEATITGFYPNAELKPGVSLENVPKMRRITFDPTNKPKQAKYFVVTGQPGIGKSCFLSYLICKRAFHGQPTIIKHADGPHFYLSEAGCRFIEKIGHTTLSNAELADPNIWYISDAIPDQFVQSPNNTNWTIVAAASPKRIDHSGYLKRVSGRTLYMSPWAWEEVFGAGVYVELMNGREIYKTWKNFNIYGPVARTLFRDLHPENIYGPGAGSGEPDLDQKIEDQIKVIIRSSSEAYFKQAWTDADSNSVVLLKPVQGDLRRCERSIITPSIGFKFATADAKHRRAGAKDFFLKVSPTLEAGSLRGYIWEEMIHLLMRNVKGDHAHLDFELEKISSDQVISKIRVVSYQEFSNLEELGEILKAPTSPDGDSKIHQVYLRPTLKNFESVDSLVVTKEEVIMFQITCGRSHPVKAQGLQRVYLKMPAAMRSLPWKLVFVIPESTKPFGAQLITGSDTLQATWKNRVSQHVMVVSNDRLK